jgi:Fanconi anemia group M protein
MAEDTRDEAYFWISRRREQEMEDELTALKGVADEVAADLDDAQTALDSFDGAAADADAEATAAEADGGAAAQPGLAEFGAADDDDAEAEAAADGVVAAATTDEDDDAVEIVVDQRELDSAIARDLSIRDGIETRLETLAVGDYVVSDRVAVERKTVSDFLDTLTGGDRSIFEQVGDLSRHYARPVVLIEGERLYEERNVHPDAIRGALASLTVDFGVSVLRTEGEGDTADLLAVLAGREQTTKDRAVSVHGEKSAKTLAEQQEYVVGAIADIGPVTARSLLEHFGSVEAVMTAREEDLLEVDGVGEVTAERIRDVVGSDYR